VSILTEQRSYVAGRWVTGDESIEVEDPATESVVASITATPASEVRRAIDEGRRCFDEGDWADRTAAERASVLRIFLDHVESQRDVIVPTLVAEAGQPPMFADMTQMTMGLSLARNTIDLYLSMQHEDHNPVPTEELLQGRVGMSLRRHEPVGVVTCITPYNAALMMAFQKIIPALMAGNSVILRPSPLTPISSLALGAAADAAGLPAGALSIVVEQGSSSAELLSSDPMIDMVSFTGSTAIGRSIAAQAAPTLKRLTLELGGKSAQIYMPDALHRVGMGAAMVVAMTAGQACVAATRMLVPEDKKDEALEAAAGAFAFLTVGPPTEEGTTLGPVISSAARERCERYVALAEEHGGKVVTGGGRPDGLDKGYYFEPTVLDLPDNSNPAARDEIFGPVLGVIGYRDLDHAVEMANDSSYGLSGQVYGKDAAAAVAIARRLRTGAVTVNSGLFSAYAPGGGYKQSGLGRERGPDGIREFQEVKHIAVGELPS